MCRGAFGVFFFLVAWSSWQVQLVSAGGLRGSSGRAPVASQVTSVTPLVHSHGSADVISENDMDPPVSARGDSFFQGTSTKEKVQMPFVDLDMEYGSSLSEEELERELAAHPLMN